MKRVTAAKRIKTHLREYQARRRESDLAELKSYRSRLPKSDCPLCVACNFNGRAKHDAGECIQCLKWPQRQATRKHLFPCFTFISAVNHAKDEESRLALIDKLEAELDRWAAEEKS